MATSLPLPEPPRRVSTPDPSPFPGLPVPNPFPPATLATTESGALLWSAWAMEGRDPQRSGRSPIVGVAQPRLSFSVAIDEPAFGQPVFAADGSIYVAGAAGRLSAFGPDGRALWQLDTRGPLPTPAVGPDGMVLIRGGDGALHAIGSDGRRRWTTDIGAQPLKLGPAPLVGPDRFAYLASYHSTLVYMVQPGGFFQWALNVSASPRGVALSSAGVLHFGAADGKLRAVDRDMVEQWSVDLGGPANSAPALGPSGTVYILAGGPSEALTATDSGGRRLWTARACWAGGAPALWPAVAEGAVQVGNCRLGADGAVRWVSSTSTWATPAALDLDGNAYFGSASALHAVGADGSPRWTYQADGQVGPPSLGPGGVVAFTSSSPNRLLVLSR